MCQEGALGLMGDWWLEASREEAMETLSYGESGSVDVPWVKNTRIMGIFQKLIGKIVDKRLFIKWNIWLVKW